MVLRAQAKDDAGALAIAAEIQKQRPKAAIGFLLEGDYLASRQKFDAAANSYRRAFQVEQTAQVVVKLSSSLSAAGKTRTRRRRPMPGCVNSPRT